VKIDRLHFHRFSSTPLECPAHSSSDKGTGEWTLTFNHQMPGIGAIWMAPALRTGMGKAPLRPHDIGGGFGTRSACTRSASSPSPAGASRRPSSGPSGVPTNTRARTATSWFLDVEVGVMADGTMTGFKVKALDDCGAFPLRAAGLHHLAQVTPGLYGWRNIASTSRRSARTSRRCRRTAATRGCSTSG
jgi:2-furoyl-CoA dehydrogenase large subunit